MLRETMLNIFHSVWPMLIIVCFILISIRVLYIKKNNMKLVFYKEILMLIFVIYVMCLFHVVSFQDVSWSTSNFIPFKEMFRYQFGSRLFFKNVLGNMIMFMPFGFFIGYVLDTKQLRYSFILSAALSCIIEIIQLVIGRVFDVDDILLNIIGGVFGFYIYYFFDYILDLLPKVLKKVWFYNILTLGILILMLLYMGNIIRLGV